MSNLDDPPHTHYAVAEIATQQIIYTGSSLSAASELMAPGTCWAKGYNGIEASRQCLLLAAQFAKRVVEQARRAEERDA